MERLAALYHDPLSFLLYVNGLAEQKNGLPGREGHFGVISSIIRPSGSDGDFVQFGVQVHQHFLGDGHTHHAGDDINHS